MHCIPLHTDVHGTAVNSTALLPSIGSIQSNILSVRILVKTKFFAIECITSIGSVFCCLFCFLSVCVPCRFFEAGPPYGPDGYLTVCDMNQKLSPWNNFRVSVHPWHSYILTFYIYLRLAEVVTYCPVRPSVRTFSFHFAGSWSSKPASTKVTSVLYCPKMKKKKMTDGFIPYGRTDFDIHCIALHCIALRYVHVALRCVR
jgi:hypothetical protein